MQIAEQVGSMLANLIYAENHGSKHHIAVTITVKFGADCSGFAPMQLGATFLGCCNACGHHGHKAAQCPTEEVKMPASHTIANCHSQKSAAKRKQNVGFNNL